MMKIMKRAMIAKVRDLFEDCSKRPREHHLISQNLLKKLVDKYMCGTRTQTRKSNRKLIKVLPASQNLKTQLKLISHYLKFPA